MALENLEPLTHLAGNENIAISTLSTMLYIAIGAIVGLFGFCLFLIKNCREDAKHAWEYVGKLSEAIKKAGTDIEIIRAFAEKGGHSGRNNG